MNLSAGFALALAAFVFRVSIYTASFTPADNYLLACGSSKNITIGGRIFTPDAVASLKVQGSSVVATSNSSFPSPLYQSVRIFRGTASYKFGIQKVGRHWIRLYFSPISNSVHDLSSASMTVVTENFVLLKNFKFRNFNNSSYMFKEYAVNVTTNSLIITFIPSNTSVAFVNAIEVVSVPDDLFPDQAMALSPSILFNGLSELALETVYRLNMGGPLITAQNDTLDRIWEVDRKYLQLKNSADPFSVNPTTIKYPAGVTPEIAPNWVYATADVMGKGANVAIPYFNITWLLPVVQNFTYFIRAHFCDIVSKSLNNLVFNVYINSSIAIGSLDLSTLTGDLAVPYYKDFVFNSSSDTLTFSVGPDNKADITNSILNGLEVLKLSNEARSLDGHYSVGMLLPKSSSRSSKIMILVVSVVAGSFVILIMGMCYCLIVIRRSKSAGLAHPWLPFPKYGNSQTMTKGSTTSLRSGTVSGISLSSTNLGRLFMFQEILDATNKFDERLLLGVGGFGRVYKGTVEDGTKVAVKRGNPRSEQGLAEFRTEIEMLSKLRHRHLVSLIGYCDERSEMILVYEYMANGPLRSHLYGSDLPSLSWKQRLEICIGAAKGLHYLHTGAAQGIIHRDVKTTNILLDESFVAKVADFGLSKAGPSLDQTHVSTAVKGSFGYLDPEYFRRQQLTEKSDVYSFGVVLMEVLCSRPALNPVLPREQVNIAEWAMSWQKKGMLDQIMDPNLTGKVNLGSLKKFGETAEKCLAEHGVERPSMGDVLWNLEYTLQLEETSSALLTDHEISSTNHIQGLQLAEPVPFDNSVSMAMKVSDGAGDIEDGATSTVFSQLVNPRGR